MRTTLRVLAVAAGIATLSLSATPAMAATLPDSDRVYILPCDSVELHGHLFEVDTVTGVATRVGDWVNPDTDSMTCAGPGAYNPVDGLGYWVAWASPAAILVSVDLETGVSTIVDEFSIEGVPYYTPLGIAIDDEGNAWATSWSSDPDVLFSVDLATAELTEVGPTGVAGSENYGLAWDSVTETVYGYNTSTNDFYTVDTTTGAFTLFNDDVLVPPRPYAMAFDSAGQVWGINGDIISAPLADLDSAEVLTVINPHPDNVEGSIYSESIIIVPGAAEAAPEAEESPELADTGAGDVTAAVALAALLLVAGGLALSRRRTAHTA